MKKKWFQRGLCAVLSATLVLGLTACGDEQKGTVSQDTSIAKQYVYSNREISDFTNLGDDFGIQDMVRGDGKIYLLMNVYHYKSDNSNNNDIKIVSMSDDGTNIQMVDLEQNLELPDTENGEENGEQPDVNGGIMPFARTENATPAEQAPSEPAVEPEENTEQTEDSEQAVPDTDTDIDIDINEKYPSLSVYEYSGYRNFKFSSDAKTLYGIKYHNKEDYNDPENPIIQNEKFLCAWDIEGNLLWEQDMAEMYASEEEYWIGTTVSLSDGSLLMLLEGEKTVKFIVDKKGDVVEAKEMNEGNENLNNLSTIITKEDGTAYAVYWDQDWRYQYIADYDFETGKMGEGAKMPERLARMGYNGMSVGYNTDLVFSTDEGVFTYNIGDEDLTQVMSFVNSDLYSNGLYYIIMLDDDHFIGFYNDMEDYTTRAGYFTKVAPEDIPDKKVLLVAAYYLNYDMKKRIINFNKTNEEYRIVYKEYEIYATEDDYLAGYKQLNNDIISGNMPDILVCNSDMPVENYISKGLLADVGKLIEKDEELSKAEFLENAFNAYKVNNKLYYVIPSFNVRSIAGKKSVLGDKTSWTMSEFRELMDSLPEGTLGFGEMTKESFISTMLFYCGSDFVDVSTGKCKFDSQNFIDMLEYANTLPTEIDYSKWEEDDYWTNYGSQWRDERTILLEIYLSSMRDVNRSINGSFGEEVNFIGFPTDSGKGNVISTNNFYAISSQSANQDGAWQFLRYYLTEEYQDQLNWQIPTNRKSYQKWLVEGMQKPYWEDENGQKVEYDETYYINGEEIILPVMTQEEVDKIGAFIESVDKPAYRNTDVQNIISEEVAAFFEGQKSAQAVAEIIQSRVKLYVNENM